MIALPTPPGSGGSLLSSSTRLDPIGERGDLLEQRLAAARSLARDIGAREIEQVRHVRAHLAVEATHGAVGPRVAVLVRAQVMLHEEADRLALVARKREARRHAVEHARTDLCVTVEVHALGGERARRHLPDVVQQCGPADERATHRLLDDLLRVRPDVLVLAARLLDEIDRRLELGEQHAQDARVLHPLERSVDIAAHEGLLHGVLEARLVGICESRCVILRDTRDGIGRGASLLGDRSCDLDENDGIDLDETANTVSCRLLGHR
jgi:hypothetical protein